MYLNVPYFSDIRSYEVLSQDGNIATVIEVKRYPLYGVPIPDDEAWSAPYHTGNPFKIVKFRGNWGYWSSERTVHHAMRKRYIKEFQDMYASRKDIALEFIPVEGYPELVDIHVITLTPSGKPRKNFVKMNDHFDYNCYFRCY